jgi:hypothetical protein
MITYQKWRLHKRLCVCVVILQDKEIKMTQSQKLDLDESMRH